MQQTVRDRFSKIVEDYEHHAKLQKEVAGRLAAALKPWSFSLPDGVVLELGAGTGLLTRKLCELMPGRKIIVSDRSEKMLGYCKSNLSDEASDNLSFEQLDAEKFEPGANTYSLVIGNFVAQWFRDPALTLGRFVDAIQPGGLLLVSFPGHQSFPEWRQKCTELGIPYTGNNLPNTEEMVIKLSAGPAQVDFYEDSRSVEFPDSLSFFRQLKKIGADATFHDKRLNTRQFKLLLSHWDESVSGPVRVTWHLVFLALKKDL